MAVSARRPTLYTRTAGRQYTHVIGWTRRGGEVVGRYARPERVQDVAFRLQCARFSLSVVIFSYLTLAAHTKIKVKDAVFCSCNNKTDRTHDNNIILLSKRRRYTYSVFVYSVPFVKRKRIIRGQQVYYYQLCLSSPVGL